TLRITLYVTPPRPASATLFPYTTLFRSLGMGLVKGELEDLAFMHLEPAEYARIAREVERRMKGSQAMIAKVRSRLETKLSEAGRSEEHTSELQSRSDPVCRLLLEQKNGR